MKPSEAVLSVGRLAGRLLAWLDLTGYQRQYPVTAKMAKNMSKKRITPLRHLVNQGEFQGCWQYSGKACPKDQHGAGRMELTDTFIRRMSGNVDILPRPKAGEDVKHSYPQLAETIFRILGVKYFLSPFRFLYDFTSQCIGNILAERQALSAGHPGQCHTAEVGYRQPHFRKRRRRFSFDDRINPRSLLSG